MGEIWRKLIFLLRRRQMERDLEEEMRFHAEMSGTAQFGNLTLLKEESRLAWGFGWLERAAHDLRFAARLLRKSPGFTAVAVASLALGIGGNTAIFSVIDAVLLRSLPVRHPEQLVAMSRSTLERSGIGSFPYPLYRELRDREDIFNGLLCQAGMRPSLSVQGNTERVSGEMVSANYFDVLGLRPYAGRLFHRDDETAPGANRVVVLSYGYWQRRFGGAESIIGSSISLNATPMTVVGVSPPEFDGLNAGHSVDVRVPITMQPQMSQGSSMLGNRNDWWLNLVGRLHAGVSRDRAEGELTTLVRRYLDEAEGERKSAYRRRIIASGRVHLADAGTGLVNREKSAAKQLYVLMAVVALVLLAGCLNVANLLLARTAARQREIAVRLSLGAARARIVRQLLTESILLASIGGVLGMTVATWGSRMLAASLTAGQQGVSINVNPDARILAFTVALSLLTGLLFGVAPALQSTRTELAPDLKGTRTGFPGVHVAWPKALVSLQVALSLILLIGTGLFLRSLVKLQTIDLGFDPANVLEVSADPTLNGYSQAQAQLFYRELGNRVSRLPGVVSVSFSGLALVAGSAWGSGITVEGYQPKESDHGPLRDMVGPGYFTTLRIPIVRGRDFGPQDRAGSPHVAIVNQRFARLYFGDRSPLGKRIGAGGDGDRREPADFVIVGVAKDGKYAGLREQAPSFWYIPYEQFNESRKNYGLTMYVRTAGDPRLQLNAVRQAARGIDSSVPLFGIRTLAEQVGVDLATDRMVAALSTFFSLLAALIVAIGLYGMMTYSVTGRTREIGIRMALGARPRVVVVSLLREAAWLVGAGFLLGVPCALALGRFLASLLYEVKPSDSIAVLCACGLELAVAVLAGWLPSRRAALIDPAVALRSE